MDSDTSDTGGNEHRNTAFETYYHHIRSLEDHGKIYKLRRHPDVHEVAGGDLVALQKIQENNEEQAKTMEAFEMVAKKKLPDELLEDFLDFLTNFSVDDATKDLSKHGLSPLLSEIDLPLSKKKDQMVARARSKIMELKETINRLESHGAGNHGLSQNAFNLLEEKNKALKTKNFELETNLDQLNTLVESKNYEVEDKHQKILDLESELDLAHQDHIRMIEDIRELESQEKNLGLIKEKDEKIEILETLCAVKDDEHQTALNDIEDKLSNAESLIQQHQTTKATDEAKFKAMATELSIVKDLVQKHESTIAANNKMLKDVDNKLSTSNKLCQEYLSTISSKTKEVKDLTSKLLATENLLKTDRSTIAANISMVKELRAEISDAKQLVQAHQHSVVQKDSEIQALTNQLNSAKETVQTNEHNLKIKDAEILALKALEKVVSTHVVTIENQTEEIRSLNIQIKNASDLGRRDQELIQNKDQQLQLVRDEVAIQEQKHAAAINTKDSQIDGLHNDLSGLNEKLSHQEDLIISKESKFQQAIIEFNGQIAKLEADVLEKTQLLATTKHDLKDAKTTIVERETALSTSISEAEDKYNKLHRLHTAFAQEMEKTQEDLRKLTGEKVQLIEEQKDAQDEIKVLQRQVEDTNALELQNVNEQLQNVQEVLNSKVENFISSIDIDIEMNDSTSLFEKLTKLFSVLEFELSSARVQRRTSEELGIQVNGLKEQLHNLPTIKISLAAVESELQRTKQQLEEMERARDNTFQERIKVETELSAVKSAKVALESSLLTSKTELNRIQDDYKNLIQTQANYAQIHQQVEAELSITKTNLNTKQFDLLRVQNDLSGKESTLLHNELLLKTLQASFDTLKVKYDGARTILAAKNRYLDSTIDAKNEAQFNLKEKAQDLTLAETKIADLKAEIVMLKSTVRAAIANAERSTDQIETNDTLRLDLNNSTSELQEATKLLASKTAEIKAFNQEKGDLVEVVKVGKARLADAEENYRLQAEELTSVLTALSKANKELESVLTERNGYRKERDLLQSQLQEKTVHQPPMTTSNPVKSAADDQVRAKILQEAIQACSKEEAAFEARIGIEAKKVEQLLDGLVDFDDEDDRLYD
jgi:chromosome segregation ATPase